MRHVFIHLWRGKGPVSAAIRWQTRGAYAHAGIQVGAYLWEAEAGKGVNRHASTERQGDAVYALSLPAGQSEALALWLDRQVGKPYDWLMCARFLTREQESRRTRGQWFCSELVFAGLRHAGTELFRETEPWEVSPSLLPRSPLLRRVQ